MTDQQEAPAIPAVIVHVPHNLGPVDALIRHQPWGSVEVDVRPSNTRQAWTPIAIMGGSFEVAP